MEIIKEPAKILLDDIILYKMSFKSLTELEMYLRSDPKVNSKVFKQMMSERANINFAGEPLDIALNYCHGGYQKNFEQFLRMKRMMDGANMEAGYAQKRRTIPSVVGSRPNVPAFIAGAPKTMLRLERVKEKKFVDVYMNLAYSGHTTEEQIINRGILTLNLVSILESHGLGVNLRVFEACYVSKEVFLAETVIKRPNETLNVGKCFFPLCGKEFNRRLMLRLKESMPFKADWGISYGLMLDEQRTRRYLGIDKKKILIMSPSDMGIIGKDIYADADAFISKLHLEDTITLPKYSGMDKSKWNR